MMSSQSKPEQFVSCLVTKLIMEDYNADVVKYIYSLGVM